jgi:arsenate reductase
MRMAARFHHGQAGIALFICTRNSARSIMAEVLLNSLGSGRFRAYSAGSRPSGHVHPMALQTLVKQGLITTGLHSKDWTVFSGPDAPVLDFVFTVCDNAAGETCPVWPGQPMTAHWGLADPAMVDGDEPEQIKAFRDAATVLRRRIELMLALPLQSLDRLSLQQAVDRIGRE